MDDGGQGGEKCLMELDFVKYNRPHPKIVGNVCSEVSININKMKYTHLQQPLLRIINFFTEQVVPAASGGGGSEKKEPGDSSTKASQGLETPSLSRMNIVIANPQILVKPRPYSAEFIAVDLGKIVVSNRFY